MAVTALTIITRALRLTNVVAGSESVSDEDATVSLEAMNAMIHAWKAEGVDTGHVDLALTDDFPLEDKHRQGTSYILALTLAGEFGAEVTPAVALGADVGWRALLADYPIIDDAVMPTELSHMPLRHTGTSDGI